MNLCITWVHLRTRFCGSSKLAVVEGGGDKILHLLGFLRTPQDRILL